MIQNISAVDLRRAADIQDKIEGLQSELIGLLGGEVRNGARASNKISLQRGKRKMSAAAKAKIAAAQRARWAKVKAAKK